MDINLLGNQSELEEMDSDELFVLDFLRDLTHGNSMVNVSENSETPDPQCSEEVILQAEDNGSIISKNLHEHPVKVRPSLMKKGIYSEITGFFSHAYEYKFNPEFSESPYKEYLEEILLLGDSIIYCFSDEGLLLSKERVVYFVCKLGKYVLQMPGLISTVLGIDSFMIATKMYIALVNPDYTWAEDASTKLPPIESDISSIIIELDEHEFSKSQMYKIVDHILNEMAFCYSGGKFENINGVHLSYLAIALNYLLGNLIEEYKEISQTLLVLTNSICECINTKFFELEEDVYS